MVEHLELWFASTHDPILHLHDSIHCAHGTSNGTTLSQQNNFLLQLTELCSHSYQLLTISKAYVHMVRAGPG